MVVKRFLAVFFPSAEFMVTTRITTVAKAGKDYKFQTNGKVLVKPGWLAVYGKRGAGGRRQPRRRCRRRDWRAPRDHRRSRR